MSERIEKILRSNPTMEGAGVKLKRVFGFDEVPLLDPFLLLDHFGSGNPEDYLAGFPWHPHRGIETVTYMIAGRVEHGDSIGNEGIIQTGDVQWMSAGSGIIHQEMPQRFEGQMMGFQLWVNLPASQKMMNPRYRDVKRNQIPTISNIPGTTIKVISGEISGVKGPVRDIVVDIEYIDVSLVPNTKFEHPVKSGYKTFGYIYEGKGYFDTSEKELVDRNHGVLFKDTGGIYVESLDEVLSFILISGAPIKEPVAWRGPIVMNTDEELDIAFKEYQDGSFIKDK
jgi:redox-sensitive bicupin YhaK (pirin superfamily)